MAQTLNYGAIKKVLNMLLDDDTAEFYDQATGDTDERERAINNAYAQLYTWAASLNDGMGPEVTETTLDIVADIPTIALPADFYRLVSLYWKQTENQSYQWPAISVVNQHEYRRKVARGSRQLGFYIRGSNIVVVPTPSYSASAVTSPASLGLYLEYVPHPSDMTLDTDVPTGIPPVHRELIAYEAFIRLKEKEGVPPSQGAQRVHSQLRAAFDRDLETRQLQNSRRLSGPTGYDIYESGF